MSLAPVTLIGNDVTRKRQEIKEYFNNTYELFESIFEILKDDSIYYKKSEPTRHPMVFYFGHTATFFINKLILMKIIDTRINENFESMFAIGVDEMSWDDMNGSNYQWPDINEVREYRQKVKDLINTLIDTLPLTLPIEQNDPFWIILMGIEHERIHLETSLVLHRQMPIEFIKQNNSFNLFPNTKKAPTNELVKINGGLVKLGKDTNHHFYGWDNEYGTNTHELQSFQISKYLVSNEEFKEFVDANGYLKKEYWCDEGLKFLKDKNTTYPCFWIKQDDGSFKYRALDRIIPLPLDWPVDVNALEAKAFLRFKSEKDNCTYSLPSEFEYKRVLDMHNIQDVDEFDLQSANFNFKYFSSSSIDAHKFGEMYDVVGNAWQWTNTNIDGFDGFKPHPAYDDFSTPTFDKMHSIIAGSSWASSGNLIMKHSRYAFRRHFYQNASFRYVISENNMNNNDNIYETDELVSQYCNFQYSSNALGVQNFSIACANKVFEYTKKTSKALDLGCATGRLSFELAKKFKTVHGIDFSARFVQVCSRLKDGEKIQYKQITEGELYTNKTIDLKSLGYSNIIGDIEFWQGDACNLKPHFKEYDLIIATNLIDRLYNPYLFLNDTHNRLNSGGILILTSPYTWLEEYTKKEFWLGGYKDKDGNEIKTIETLKKELSEHFEFLEEDNIPFVIPETNNKHQYTFSNVTVWRKK